MSPDPDDHNVLPVENGYRFYTQYYGPSHEDVSMVASFGVPDEWQSLPAGKDFSAQTGLTVYFPRDIFKEDAPLHKAILEGTLTSTLPFFLELKDIVVNPGITCTLDKVLLAPSLANETSSVHFTMQLESGKDLKSLLSEATFLFRLYADDSCAGKPINESGCISLTDVVVKY